jgi:hypothetical protein
VSKTNDMIKIYFLFLALICCQNGFGQQSIYTKPNAIQIDNPESLDDDVYKAVVAIIPLWLAKCMALASRRNSYEAWQSFSIRLIIHDRFLKTQPALKIISIYNLLMPI